MDLPAGITAADVDRYAPILAASCGDGAWIGGRRRASGIDPELMLEGYREDVWVLLAALAADGRLRPTTEGGRP